MYFILFLYKVNCSGSSSSEYYRYSTTRYGRMGDKGPRGPKGPNGDKGERGCQGSPGRDGLDADKRQCCECDIYDYPGAPKCRAVGLDPSAYSIQRDPDYVAECKCRPCFFRMVRVIDNIVYNIISQINKKLSNKYVIISGIVLISSELLNSIIVQYRRCLYRNLKKYQISIYTLYIFIITNKEKLLDLTKFRPFISVNILITLFLQ